MIDLSVIYVNQYIRCSDSAADQNRNVSCRLFCAVPEHGAERPVRSPHDVVAVSERYVSCGKSDVLVFTVTYIVAVGDAFPWADLEGSVRIYAYDFSCI